MTKTLSKMPTVVLMILCCLFVVLSVQAEELRIMTYQGTAPEGQLETFKALIKEKYDVDLEVTLSFLSAPEDSYRPLKNKEVDIVSSPHNLPKDSRYKYIDGKLVIPVDLENIPNYRDLIPALQRPEYITENDEVYGVAYAYALYGLAYNTTLVPDAPSSWNVLWDPQYAGKYSLSADFYEVNVLTTALAMGVDKDALGTLDAVRNPGFPEKLSTLAKNAGNLWVGIDTADNLEGLAFGAVWGFSFHELKNRGEVWKFADPQEGTTCGVGNWMLSHTLQDNPTLKRIAEEWINFTLSPEYQRDVVIGTMSNFPVNLVLKNSLSPEEAKDYLLDDPDYFLHKLILWPLLDKRTRTGFELFWKKATRS